MLFILGLTFFVSVIAQTRLLEGITFFLLRRNRGAILPTVISITAVVAFASGILDGVSMIGLTIRTLVIIMMLAAAPIAAVRYAVMVCTAVTTICGIWLAYGEPPNLIMKANLYPYLGQRLLSALLRAGRRRQLHRHRLAAARQAAAASASISTTWTSSTPTPPTCAFCRRRAMARCMTPVELIEGHAADLHGRAAPGHRTAARRRVAGPGDDSGRRLRADPPRCCWPLRHGRTRRRTRQPLRAGQRRQVRGGVPGRTGGRRSAGGDGQGPASRPEDWRDRAGAVRRTAGRRTASITRCRCFSRRSRASSPRCPGIARIPKMRGAGDAGSEAGVCGILLSVSAVSVDHPADDGGILRRDAGAGPPRHRDPGPARMSPSPSFSAARFCPRFSTTTSSPTSPRAVCTAWT